jgi:hypothetical protein
MPQFFPKFVLKGEIMVFNWVKYQLLHVTYLPVFGTPKACCRHIFEDFCTNNCSAVFVYNKFHVARCSINKQQVEHDCTRLLLFERVTFLKFIYTTFYGYRYNVNFSCKTCDCWGVFICNTCEKNLDLTDWQYRKLLAFLIIEIILNFPVLRSRSRRSRIFWSEPEP